MLARFTTKIIAVKPNIPSCFPTVTALRKVNWKWTSLGTVAGSIPETVLPVWLVAGDFDVLRDTFTTRSGREWRWSCMSIVATLIVRRGQ